MQDSVQAPCRVLCRLPAGFCAGSLQDYVQAPCRVLCRFPAGFCAGSLQALCRLFAGFLAGSMQAPCRLPAGSLQNALQAPCRMPCRISCRHPAGSLLDSLQAPCRIICRILVTIPYTILQDQPCRLILQDISTRVSTRRQHRISSQYHWRIWSSFLWEGRLGEGIQAKVPLKLKTPRI